MGVKGREAYTNCVTREDFMILTDETNMVLKLTSPDCPI